MSEPPYGELGGAPESDSPRQANSPGDLESPPENPGNSDHDQAAAPPPSERQVAGDIISDTETETIGEQATQMLQPVNSQTV
jgi:hypothetical protein